MSFLNFLQYRIMEIIILYNALSIHKQIISCPLSKRTCVSYLSGTFSGIISINCLLIFIIILFISNTIYICTNKFSMYRNITSYLCFASITPIVIISSDSSVRLVTSSRKMYTRCMISFAHILYLTVLFLFSFNKSRRSVALFFPSLFIY